MTLRVGVIGTGMIGRDHIRRITHVLSGAMVVAVSDSDPAVATAVAAQLGAATVHASGEALVNDPAVEAVLVCSWGPTHEAYVLASIAAGKPVFCEKPLATTEEACRRILDAEVAAGRRLVQVGFMRRYDASYRALKEVIDAGDIGAPLLFHSVHRNPDVPSHYTGNMAIVDTAVHDFDVARWLLREEIVAIRVLAAKPNRHGHDLLDPLLMVLETESGVLIDVETSVNIRYGYDIRGEVVGEDGTVALADLSPVVVRRAGAVSGRVAEGWQQRFSAAYDTEVQAWIHAVRAGEGAHGPSSWDGLAAAVVCEAGLQALATGKRVSVALGDKPGLYA